jgi:succinate-acetate transporter protein
MVWHILTIVSGVLTAIAAVCPAWCSNVTFGVLTVIFALLALRKFQQLKRKA